MLETRIHLDSNGQDLAVEHVQDVEPILERNKMLRTMEQKSDWGREIAEIPNVILVRWLNEEHAKGNTTIKLLGEEMDRLVDRKLKDPEWAYLRTDKRSLIVGYMGFGS
jgi:hypothetical protein